MIDSWKNTMLAHFCVYYAADKSSAGFSDHYIYLLPALINIPSDEISEYFFKFFSRGIPIGGKIPDPLIDWACDLYEKTTNRDISNIFFHKTFDHKGFRVFTQNIENNNQLIDFWLSASAICASISIVFAQYQSLMEARFIPNQEGFETAQITYFKKISAFQRLLDAWKKNGYIMFDRHSELDLDEVTCKRALNNFLNSFLFILYHELAHNHLGHLKENNATLASTEKRHMQEFQADEDAIKILLKSTNNKENIGPLIVFVSASILQDEEDNLPSASHPSLIDRVNCYLDAMEEFYSDKSRYYDWTNKFIKPCTRSLFLNLNDRDRCPAWFGHTRAEFEDGIKNHVELDSTAPFSDSNFSPNDYIKIKDPTRPRPRGRKLGVEFI
jgi:hypothetical protein